MKQKILFITLLLAYFLVSPPKALAAYFSFSPSSGSVSDPQTIELEINTEGESVESAAAVVTFDSTQVLITEVNSGGFFDSLSVDDSQDGRITVTGTLNMANRSSVTGSGVLATLTLQPQITSGSFELAYECSSAVADDSNILDTSGTNLLATDQQCEQNIEGSYTVGSSDGDEDTDTGDDDTTTTSDDSNDDGVQPTPTSQPTEPDSLPQTGPEDWWKWVSSGLTLIGLGLLLF